jgi:hypothetical protein
MTGQAEAELGIRRQELAKHLHCRVLRRRAIGCEEPKLHEPRGDRRPAFGHSLIGVDVGDRQVVLDGLLAPCGSGVTRLAHV